MIEILLLITKITPRELIEAEVNSIFLSVDKSRDIVQNSFLLCTVTNYNL